MKKTEHKPLHWSKGVALATAAATVTSTATLMLTKDELAAGVQSGDIALYLPLGGDASIDISHMTTQEKILFPFILEQAKRSENGKMAVDVTTGSSRGVCQIYLSAEEILRLSQIPAPRTALAQEKLAPAMQVCSGGRLVPDSMKVKGPYSVVAPEGRVAMEQLVINKLTIGKS